MATNNPTSPKRVLARGRAGNPKYLPAVRVWTSTLGIVNHIRNEYGRPNTHIVDAAIRHYAMDVLGMDECELDNVKQVVGYSQPPNKPPIKSTLYGRGA